MGCAKVTVTLVLALAIGFGFILNRETPDGIMNKPIPDDISNPRLAKFLIGVTKVLNQLLRMFVSLGFGDELTLKRKLSDMLLSPGDHKNVTVTNKIVDGVTVRLYVPDGVKPDAPGIVFYHGGGWSLGNTIAYDVVTEIFARRIQAVVISVDYRLAPEHPYPIPLDDCITVTKYFITHASEFGVNPNRIAIAGDSSGGNTAAAVALRLRDEKFKPMPRVQVLVYPCLQGVDFKLPSFQDNSDMFGDARVLVEFFQFYIGLKTDMIDAIIAGNHTSARTKQRVLTMRKYLPRKYTARHPIPQNVHDGDPQLMKLMEHYFLNPYIFPLMASDLSGLPEAYLSTAEYDLVRDDGIIYAERLKEAKVKVTLVHEDDGMHGALNHQIEPFTFDVSVRMMNSLVNYLSKTL